MTRTSSAKVSVVVPVLNAEGYLPDLLDAIQSQSPDLPLEIILVDSMSTDGTARIANAYAAKNGGVKLVTIENFSHGRARNLGVSVARGEYVVLMSQDALPRDDAWLSNLLAPFEDERIAGTYGRQVPRPDTNPMERFFLQSRFPDSEPVVRRKVAGETLSLESVFYSNVSAAFRRDVLLEYPFDESLIMSEDQQWARDVIDAGYATVYVPSSVVIHSHDYDLRTVFRRYFDSVHSLTLIFPNHGIRTTASMGGSYLWNEARYIVSQSWSILPYFFVYTLAKTLGALCGLFAGRIPKRVARQMSLHRYYWK